MSAKLASLAENDPIAAAYGAWRESLSAPAAEAARRAGRPRWIPIEWDIYLEPGLLGEFARAADDGDKTTAGLLAHDLFRTAIVAHGSPVHVVLEHGARIPQYSSVSRHGPWTAAGGLRTTHWLTLFTQALVLACRAEEPGRLAGLPVDDVLQQSPLPSLDLVMATLHYVLNPGAEAAANEDAVLCSVALDIKSSAADGRVLTALVQELNHVGVQVFFVGSFIPSQLEGLRHLKQEVRVHALPGERRAVGVRLPRPPPTEAHLLHLIGDLQHDCERGRVQPGANLWLNAGSFLSHARWATSPRAMAASYRLMDDVVQDVVDLKQRFEFHLGLYVQETSTDATAATLIIKFVNEHRSLVDLGFAWGGLSEKALSDVQPSRIANATGRGPQDWIGLPFRLSDKSQRRWACTKLGLTVAAAGLLLATGLVVSAVRAWVAGDVRLWLDKLSKGGHWGAATQTPQVMLSILGVLIVAKLLAPLLARGGADGAAPTSLGFRARVGPVLAVLALALAAMSVQRRNAAIVCSGVSAILGGRAVSVARLYHQRPHVAATLAVVAAWLAIPAVMRASDDLRDVAFLGDDAREGLAVSVAGACLTFAVL